MERDKEKRRAMKGERVITLSGSQHLRGTGAWQSAEGCAPFLTFYSLSASSSYSATAQGWTRLSSEL